MIDPRRGKKGGFDAITLLTLSKSITYNDLILLRKSIQFMDYPILRVYLYIIEYTTDRSQKGTTELLKLGCTFEQVDAVEHDHHGCRLSFSIDVV